MRRLEARRRRREKPLSPTLRVLMRSSTSIATKQECLLMLRPAPGRFRVRWRVAGDLLSTILGDDTGSRLALGARRDRQSRNRSNSATTNTTAPALYMLSASLFPGDVMNEKPRRNSRRAPRRPRKNGVHRGRTWTCEKTRSPLGWYSQPKKPAQSPGTSRVRFGRTASRITLSPANSTSFALVTVGQNPCAAGRVPAPSPPTTVLVGPLEEVAGVAAQ